MTRTRRPRAAPGAREPLPTPLALASTLAAALALAPLAHGADGTMPAPVAVTAEAEAAAAAAAQKTAVASAVMPDLADLSLEQLRDIVVTAVSRRAARLDQTAASVWVISADDIRRAGATTVPEALRLAPTLAVARADANQYAISARGFNNVLANKLLVVIDGRPVYTPLFSGVFWEAQDVVLDDVDRIEVVTGPATAAWGSNAVNGLIHIVTRSAAATQGASVSASVGSAERSGALRYGAQPGDNGALGAGGYRLYAKTYDRRQTHRADGSPVGDAADGTQVGFRADWGGALGGFTLQGDAYRATIDQATSARKIGDANLLGRWQRTFADGADASVQVYVDHTSRDQPPSIVDTLQTVDGVAQVGFRLADGQRLLFGGGLRRAHDATTSFGAVGFDPPSRSLSWARLFGEDEIAVSQRLTLTLAASVETNPYTGAQFLPSVRAAWRTSGDGMLWAAASRAVRAPSRIDREFVQPVSAPRVVDGGPDFRSEVSHVFELGWRAQPTPRLSYSATLFHHEHDGLRSLAPTPQGLQFQNGFEGSTRGVEGWVRWRVSDRWRLDGGLALMRASLRLRPGAADATGAQALGNDPREQWSLRSAADITGRLSWDVSLRHVGSLPAPAVPSYTAVDTRLAFNVQPNTEVALAVQNLFDPAHPEWGAAGNRVEVERAVTLQLRWRR